MNCQFPCTRCGGEAGISAGTPIRWFARIAELHNAIAAVLATVPLLDFLVYTGQLAGAAETHDQLVVHCTSCGAETLPGDRCHRGPLRLLWHAGGCRGAIEKADQASRAASVSC